MIIIAATGSTEVILNLYGRVSNISDPEFTFEITNKVTNERFVFYQEDHSNNKYYYNSFTLSVATNSTGLTSGYIPLYKGEWEYNIYEMEDAYNLNTNDSIGLVDNGILVYFGTQSDILSYTQSDSNVVKYPVYG